VFKLVFFTQVAAGYTFATFRPYCGHEMEIFKIWSKKYGFIYDWYEESVEVYDSYEENKSVEQGVSPPQDTYMQLEFNF